MFPHTAEHRGAPSVYRRDGQEWRVASFADGDRFDLPTLSAPVAVAEIYDRILDSAGRSLLR
jgi:hypothetical protein